MKARYLITAAVETIIKVVVLAAVVVFIVRGASKAYDFGYRVFADEPISVSGGRTITVGISENMSVKDIALMLEEKGLIEDADLFVVQELLSAYHGELRPGIYDLGTDMTATQMMEIMSASGQETEEDKIS
ncbi:MAG: aminodeoxychorismate lyase [Suilimivivens sp.]|nr:endolytic transglycosylase MltG [Lachnospiraceae bacterium]MDY5870740.1 aminodeoxychorismate lyase [Lachnospiraceae bacterium]